MGANKTPAIIEFSDGLNVICGASETGKSFIVSSIDFMLGGKTPPPDIPQRIGYEKIRLGIKIQEKGDFTLERSLQGGDFLLFEGLVKTEPPKEEGVELGAQHVKDKSNTVSGWLLDSIGLLGKMIKKNKDGAVNFLSFRILEHLILVKEQEISKQISPLFSGQFTSATTEKSAFKLLLTGVDDSSLIKIKKPKEKEFERGGVEVIDEMLAGLEEELESSGLKREEIEDKFGKISTKIETRKRALGLAQKNYQEEIFSRNKTLEKLQRTNGRAEDIHQLLARFDLLKQHYAIDIERLRAIKETGSLFYHLEKEKCPLCGADPEAQHKDEQCDGNVENLVKATDAEINKIATLSKELNATISDLTLEQKELEEKVVGLKEIYNLKNNKIRSDLSEEIDFAQEDFSILVKERETIHSKLFIFEQIDKLNDRKNKILQSAPSKQDQKKITTEISKSVLNEFAKFYEQLLKNWHFPGGDRVYFDEESMDFVIDGKPRSSQGQGLRAITHAAFNIALMDFCISNSKPHPGFVIIDSPLLAYSAPEGESDSLIGTDVKEQFYENLEKNFIKSQIIIIENEHPLSEDSENLNNIIFTKNPDQGRYGFFPIS